MPVRWRNQWKVWSSDHSAVPLTLLSPVLRNNLTRLPETDVLQVLYLALRTSSGPSYHIAYGKFQVMEDDHRVPSGG